MLYEGLKTLLHRPFSATCRALREFFVRGAGTDGRHCLFSVFQKTSRERGPAVGIGTATGVRDFDSLLERMESNTSPASI